jgi:hypothetical protein
MMNTTKKLPPFGKALAEHLKIKNYPNNDVYLFLGAGAWQRAKNFTERGRVALVLPLGETPANYLWPVHGCDVLTVITSELPAHIVKLTAHALLLAGARVVRVLLAWNGKMPAIYRRAA